mgnify:CR=1 FL=1|nr:MAG TPA: tail tape measure protein [Caudoviricetes sp.]
MGADGHLLFDTKLDSSGFSSGIGKLGGLAKTGLAVVAGAIAAVSSALVAGAVAGIKYNASIEEYQTSFEVMTGSAEKAAEVIGRLKKVGAETPFELPQLADTTQLLMNYGFTADEAMDKMMMLGDISQGSADKMSRIATAYGQMSSAGKVQLEDIKQMIEAGFNPLQEISNSTGESMESLYDRISNGTLSVDEITASMERATSEGGKYYQSMEKQSQTFNGLISTIKDSAQQLIGEIVEPISASMTETLLPSAIEAIEALTTAFRENGVEGLIEAGMQILVNLINGIALALPSLIETACQVIQSFIENINLYLPQLLAAGGQILLVLINGIVSLLPSLYTLGINIITTLLNALVANAPQIIIQALTMMKQWLSTVRSHLPEVMQSGAQIILDLLQGLIDNAPQILAQAATMMAEFVMTILTALGSVVNAGLTIIVGFLSGILSRAGEIPTQAANMMAEFIYNIISRFGDLLSAGVDIIANILSGIGQKVSDVINAAGDLISDFISKFTSTNWLEVGSNIVSGIASGIAKGASAIADAARNAASNALQAAKNFLGIHSPSTVFRDQVGKYMALGVGVGFEDNLPVDDMNDGVKSAVSSIQNAADSVLAKTPITTDGAVRSVTNNYTGNNIDYRMMKKVYREALDESNEKPVVLNERELRRALA